MSGIPIDDIHYNEMNLVNIDDKVDAIIKAINPTIEKENYKITTIPPAEGRNTQICKFVLINLNTKCLSVTTLRG